LSGPGEEGDVPLPSRRLPRWESLLARAVEITGAERELGEVMGRVAELITEAMEADACFVHLLDESGEKLVLAGATPPFRHLVGTIELRLGEGVAGWVAQTGRPAVVDDKWRDPRYKYIPALRGEDYASLVSLPLVRPGRPVVGVFNVHSRRRRHYADEELDVLTAVAGLLAGIVENFLLYHRLAERERELERFAARTVELQELERRRLAAEIHDGISQQVVSLAYRLSAAHDLLPPGHDQVVAELAAARELAAGVLDETRRAIAGLRPSVLDDLGLAAGLRVLARAVPEADVEVDAEECQLPAHVETALFRIAQEAVQNVVKHAAANRVRIDLHPVDGGTRLVIADDGRGFDARRRPAGGVAGTGGYGLVSIEERAALVGARVEVESHPGRGTTVTVSFPAPDPLR
jgi:two-component system NarL family sensor kinase